MSGSAGFVRMELEQVRAKCNPLQRLVGKYVLQRFKSRMELRANMSYKRPIIQEVSIIEEITNFKNKTSCMKKSLFALFLLGHLKLVGQNQLESVSIAKYLALDESAGIAAFDKDYAGKSIAKVDLNEINSFYENQKFQFVKNLVEKYQVKPTRFLEGMNRNYSFVCGVGLKRTKDLSPSCKPALAYEENNNSKTKIEIVQLCLAKGEKPTSDDLESCLYKNELGVFKVLIQAHNGLSDKPTCEKWMVRAADLGHIDFIKFFLEKGFSASAKDHMGFYAFYRAVKYPDIFFLLAEHGVDIQVVGYAGTTAIIHAAREGCTEAIQYLLEKGANPEIKYGNFTAIEVAQKHNQKNSKEVVKLLKSYKKLNPKK